MSVLVATVLLTSFIMLITIAVVLLSTRLSANREQRWLDWSQQWQELSYQSRKYIDQRQNHEWTQLLQYQHRFVAHWLEYQVVAAKHVTPDNFHWLEHNWRYFECSLLIGNRMKTQSVILMDCKMPGASPWVINDRIQGYHDAFHHSHDIQLQQVGQEDLPKNLKGLSIKAERPHFVRQILTDKVADWLLQYPQLSIGWIHHTLVVYRLGSVMSPDNLSTALDQVTLLKQQLQQAKSIANDH